MPHPPSADDLDFALATQMHPRSDGVTFDTAIHPLWTVGDKPNGGYLLALLGQAARSVAAGLAAGAPESGAEAPQPDVVSAAVTYLRPPDLGPATIRTVVLRQGRTAHHVRTVLAQDGVDLVDAVFVTGEVPPPGPARYNAVRPLRAPAPEDCVRLPAQMPGGSWVGIMEATELRLDPATLPVAPGQPSDPSAVAELRGWARFADGRAVDTHSLLFFVDAVPPATLLIGSTGWVPTLQMSVYVRARPAPGWLGLRMEANLVVGGMVDETCTLWDSAGHVVAQATQLARLRFPDGPS